MWRTMLAVVLIAPFPALAQSGVTIILSPPEDIAGRQAMGIEAALFGDHAFLNGARHSIVVQPYLGFHGSESLFGGVAANTEMQVRSLWQLGAGAAVMDADLGSTTIGVHLSRTVLQSGRSGLLVQGAWAYSWSFDDDTAVYLDYTDELGQTPMDLVRIDQYAAHTLYVHAVYRLALPVLQPVLDLGFAATRYSLDGNECIPDCFDPGAPRSESDTVGNVSFGAGASLALGPVITFGGLQGSNDGGMFLVSLGGRF